MARTRISVLLTFLAVLVVLPAQPAAAAPVQADVPRFESGPCTAKLPAGVNVGRDVECGNLIVPELYENPGGKTLSLGVVIIKSLSANPQPDPVVFAQGGPGGSTIDYFTQVLFTSQLRADRDLVLFDQRGTLYSKPNLFCQELLDEQIRQLPLDLKPQDSEKEYNQAAMKCHDRLVKEGVNLSAYNSLENASDVESLRIALGYEKINLYGVSYGTLLALETMRQYPDGLRSVILDSVVPPDAPVNFLAPRSFDRSFTEFFKACQEDAHCNAAYPNLEKYFFDMVDRADKKPIIMKLTDPETKKTYDALFNSDSLVSSLGQLLYSYELIPLLPKIIEDIGQGRYAFFERVFSQFTFDRTISYGMYYSVNCSDSYGVDLKQFNYSDIRPELAKDQDLSNQSYLDLCKQWNVKPIDPIADKPVVSDIPTLIFNGRFDPITPQPFGEQVAKTLSKHYLFVFPNTGHGAIDSSACSDRIFLEFLNDPETAPDGRCIASIPPIQFITSQDVADVPGVIRLLNLEGGVTLELVLLGFYMLIMLSALVAFPLMWLIRVVRGKPGRPTPFLAHLAPWVAALNGGVLLVFVVAMVIILINMVSQRDISYLFGIPKRDGIVLVLPILSALACLPLLAFTVAGWAGKFWSVGRKIYFTLVTLAAVGALYLLWSWGMLTKFW